MASISHWGMFPVDFGPMHLEYRWVQALGGFVISSWVPEACVGWSSISERIVWTDIQ